MGDRGSQAGLPTVPGYEVLELMGRGGFAAVYEARQLSVDRTVALKVFEAQPADPDAARRFRDECRAIGGLSWHPHVVALHDAGELAGGGRYMVMELVLGGSFGDQMRREGALAPVDAVAVGVQVARALGAAHSEGILHRDVKPDNLLIGRFGEALLADFGIASLVHGTKSVTGSFVGTLAYAPPERLRGERSSVASDIYSLGATLHALLSGEHPFGRDAASPAATISQVLEQEPPPLPPDVPPGLAALIRSTMAKDPAARPPGTDALVDALTKVDLDGAGAGHPVPEPRPSADALDTVPAGPPLAPAERPRPGQLELDAVRAAETRARGAAERSRRRRAAEPTPEQEREDARAEEREARLDAARRAAAEREKIRLRAARRSALAADAVARRAAAERADREREKIRERNAERARSGPASDRSDRSDPGPEATTVREPGASPPRGDGEATTTRTARRHPPGSPGSDGSTEPRPQSRADRARSSSTSMIVVLGGSVAVLLLLVLYLVLSDA